MRRSLRSTSQTKPSVSRESSITIKNKSSNTHSRKRKAPQPPTSDASQDEDGEFKVSESEAEAGVVPKKRKISRDRKANNVALHQQLFSRDKPQANPSSCHLPKRVHSPSYHRPLLLDSLKGRQDLLQWFEGVHHARSMPWRKAWIDTRPAGKKLDPELRERLERRAYEVWISEIMLQQTRVAVVIDYWNKWMDKWPTIHDLAAADADDVLAAWRGLGYYSRATRIHEAAKKACGDSTLKGLLPDNVEELVKKVPGVGPYTAGAISAIVFGKAAPMVDGNVLRVLSRQLGIFGDVKTDKSVIDLLWAAAASLVKAVALDGDNIETADAPEDVISERPGQWGQALMELGSTTCTPKPNCDECPITASCRAYNEGLQSAVKKGLAPNDLLPADSESTRVPDIEDSCNFCKPFEEKKPPPPKNTKTKTLRQASLSKFFTGSTEQSKMPEPAPSELTSAGLNTIIDHTRKFPVKIIKRAVREEETLVCAIRRNDGRYLIHRRPQKGLLAGLWELPSGEISEGQENSVKGHKRAAHVYASGVLDPSLRRNSEILPQLKLVDKLGSVPWLFSHLKLIMHVFLFELKLSNVEIDALPKTDDRWSENIEDESMGTGMRKCWELVRSATNE
ncbi:A/G-specific adenine DNA glycosylase [Xylariaceae sp. FL1272]|nr:A/G-specific adenine DNA glycosylase [Xylariaceae sp. FL1272]